MATFGDLAFGVVGLLMIVTYGAQLSLGATPESALVIGLGGGLALGTLVKATLEVAFPADSEERPPSGEGAAPVRSRAGSSRQSGPDADGAGKRLADNAR